MNLHPRIKELLSLIGDLIPDQSNEVTYAIEICAAAILKGQLVSEMLFTYNPQPINTVRLNEVHPDIIFLANRALENAENELANLEKKSVFIRDQPLPSRGIHSPGSWHSAYYIEETIGPLLTKMGHAIWVDVYPEATLTATIKKNSNGDALLYLLNSSTFEILQQQPGDHFVSVEAAAAKTFVWVSASLLDNDAPVGKYFGLYARKITMEMPTYGIDPNKPYNLIIAPHAIDQGHNIIIEMTLSETPFNDNVSSPIFESQVQLPKRMVIEINNTGAQMIEFTDNAGIQFSQTSIACQWNNAGPKYRHDKNAIIIPMEVSEPLIHTIETIGSKYHLSANVQFDHPDYVLPLTSLDHLLIPSTKAFASIFTSGLHISFPNYILDANNRTAVIEIPNTTLLIGDDSLQLMDQLPPLGALIHLSFTQALTPSEKITGTFVSGSRFSFHCSGRDELFEIYHELSSSLSAPVFANGKAILDSIKLNLSCFYHAPDYDFAGTSSIDMLPASTDPDELPTIESIVLRNAILGIAMPYYVQFSFINFVSSQRQANAANIFCHLHRFEPILDNPYVANIDFLRHRQEGSLSNDQHIGEQCILNISLQSKDEATPTMHFKFGATELNHSLNHLPYWAKWDALEQYTEEAVENKIKRTTIRYKQKFDLDVPNDFKASVDDTLRKPNLIAHLSNATKNHTSFRLMDVSSAADWIGIEYGKLTKDFEITHEFIIEHETDSAYIDGMDVVASSRMVRTFMNPAFSWEPYIDIQNEDALYDPIKTYLTDGPPVIMGNSSDKPVKIDPIAALESTIDLMNDQEQNQSWTSFSLPNGMLALAININNIPSEANAFFSSPAIEFENNIAAAKSIVIRAGVDPATEKSGIPGFSFQPSSLFSQNGNFLDESPLGKLVTVIYNNNFRITNNNQPRVCGIPINRIDFSGYGANVFSYWIDKHASLAQISQANFTAWRGRLATEIVQAKANIYPFGVRSVRTIHIYRSQSAIVYRVDSGWQPESDGFFNFDYSIVLNGIRVNVPSKYEIHPGLIKGVTHVANIREVKSVNNYVRNSKGFEYTIDENTGIATQADPTENVLVALAPVVFEGNIILQQGSDSNDIVSVYCKDIVGYLQIAPVGIPISSETFADLIKDRGGLQFNASCMLNLANSNQSLKVTSIKFGVSNSTPEAIVGTVFGTPVFPNEGSWTAVMCNNSGAVTPTIPEGVPVIRRGKLNEPIEKQVLIGNPEDLLQNDPQLRAFQFGFLQNVGPQKLLFLNPSFNQSEKILHSTSQLLADSYHLVKSNAIFPSIKGLPTLSLNDFKVNILEKGYQLINPLNASKTLDIPATANRLKIFEEGGVAVFAEYNKESIDGSSIEPGKCLMQLDAEQKSWSQEFKNLGIAVDIHDYKRIFIVQGNMRLSSSSLPSFSEPSISFGKALEPVTDILQILSKLNGGDYAGALKNGLHVAMSNSPDNWHYSYKAGLEIPIICFPKATFDSPNTPLRLKCSLGLGCYFNSSVNISSTGQPIGASGGAYLEFKGEVSVMCISISLATIYSHGTCLARVSADSVNGPTVSLQMGFGAEIMIGLPVVGNVSVTYSAGVYVEISDTKIVGGAFICYKGRLELFAGLLTTQIMLEAGGKFRSSYNSNERKKDTYIVAQVVFALDISIFMVADINFTERFQDERQIA